MPIPIVVRLDALAGGVGNVWALSIPGLPEVGCGAIECGGGGALAPIELDME